jgi:hypothetical protein
VFEPPVQQQPLFQAPTSDDYYTDDTPPLEFLLDDLLGGTADERRNPADATDAVDAVDAGEAEQCAMMEDFHDPA